MRRILIDVARKKRSQKRGGQLIRHDVGAVDPAVLGESDELLALDEALTKLAASDETAAKVVQLRFFAGLPISEVAEILGVSSRTADRIWAYARAWLHQEIKSTR
jgi:RNA polymerase sigma factor (TIGR02999 family)